MLKRDLWKTGITITGALLLLVFMVWVPVSAADTHEMTSGLATPGTVTMQATPMANPTIAAQTAQEQLTKLQRDNDRSCQAWLWNSSAALGTIGAALLAVAGVLWTATVAQNKNLADSQAERDRRSDEQKHWLDDHEDERDRRDKEQKRWLKDRKDEREKRAEERFQDVVEGLGSGREEAKLGAAIMLRTFLLPEYKQFYTQVFDLAVAYLCLRKPDPQSPDRPIDLDSLSQALITVFREGYPRVYQQRKFNYIQRYIRLDNADLSSTNLDHVHFELAKLPSVNLTGANLTDANLIGADLRNTDFSNAILRRAKFNGADFTGAVLSKANITDADFTDAINVDRTGTVTDKKPP